jgi:prepilin-type N-terminal cleavage/methylation domain-containing protein
MKKKLETSLNQGFTFTEIVSTVVVVGILIAIISPSWLGFIARQQLRTSTNKIYWAMQNARSEARAERSSWQATFKRNLETDRLQYAIHSTDIMPIDLSESVWQDLPNGVFLDKKNTSLFSVDPETNRKKRSQDTGYYRVTFNYQGCPVYRGTEECTQSSITTGRVILKHQHLGERRQCVIVSTLIGALRTAEDLSIAQSSKETCNLKK